MLYAIQNEFAAPDFVYFLTSGDTVIYNVLGGIGTLVGPILGAGFFQLARQLLAQFFGDQFPYLIPLGLVFIAMIIFLPQGFSALRGGGLIDSEAAKSLALLIGIFVRKPGRSIPEKTIPNPQHQQKLDCSVSRLTTLCVRHFNHGPCCK